MRYTGSCHCKAVTFSFDSDTGLKELLRCNCSLCSRRNALMATVEIERFHITGGAQALHEYRWNTGQSPHYFCATCGVYVYHRRRSNPLFYGINARCIQGLDTESLPVRQIDGKSMPLAE